MTLKTFFLVFCLTIVIIGCITLPAAADGNATVATTIPTTVPTAIPMTIATTSATTVPVTTTVPTVSTTAATPPIVTSISPSSGTTIGGTSVTIYGSGFTGATAVSFGSATAAISTNTGTQITTTSPAGTGTVDITVTTSGGSSATGAADKFTYTAPAPEVDSISPSSGTIAGGTAVIIAGSGFTGATAVKFGSTNAASYTVNTDTQITAPSPAGSTGTVDITITTPSGTSATGSDDQYTYSAPGTTTIPVVTAISPTYGTVSVSTPITIAGSGFTGATAVTIGGTAATFTVVSDAEITATTPASSTLGQVNVIVTTPSGTSAIADGDKYSFAAAATTIPLPLFSASPTSGTAPLTVQFTDESTGNPATWSWNFGDGNTSTLENPTNTYVNDGTYSVTLTEGNSVGQNETTQAAYIVVGSSAPVAAFTASPVSGTAPLSVQFTDTSTNSPVSWIWNFGDGGTSTEENPSHIYSNPGTYTVSLTAANTAGENTATGSETVSTSEEMVAVQTPTLSLTPIPDTELPDISITGPATSGLAPLTVMFSANTPGSPEGFSWDFGDGGTSADEFPSYTYLNPGTYTVTLTVKYPSGTKTAVKNDFVTVSQKTSTSSPLPPVTTVIAIAVAAVLSLVISAKKRE